MRIERNPTNLGFIRNFGRALTFCSGDLIFLSDQDDVWHPEKIARFVARFADRPDLGLILCNAALVDDDLKPLGQSYWQAKQFGPAEQRKLTGPDGGLVFLRNPSGYAAGATMAFPGRFRALAAEIPPEWTHDAWIATAISLQAPVGLIDEMLNDYRQHSNQIVGGSPDRAVSNNLARARGATPDHFLNTARRYTTLRDHLARLGVALAPHLDTEISRKIDHWSARAAMRQRNKALRFPLIGRELLGGRYHRYSQGWKSMAMDILI